MSLIKNHVDARFKDVLLQPNGQCVNPVTGGHFLKGETGEDSIAQQKHAAAQALLAQEWFAVYGPRAAPPLPLTALDWEDMRREFGLNSLIGFYARSLAFRNWHVHEHPLFEDFARGLLAIDTGFWDLQQRVGAAVLKIYSPCPLAGMTPSAYWAPPEECEAFWAEYKRNVARHSEWIAGCRS